MVGAKGQRQMVSLSAEACFHNHSHDPYPLPFTLTLTLTLNLTLTLPLPFSFYVEDNPSYLFLLRTAVLIRCFRSPIRSNVRIDKQLHNLCHNARNDQQPFFAGTFRQERHNCQSHGKSLFIENEEDKKG
jgi:hypothetical protein